MPVRHSVFDGFRSVEIGGRSEADVAILPRRPRAFDVQHGPVDDTQGVAVGITVVGEHVDGHRPGVFREGQRVVRRDRCILRRGHGEGHGAAVGAAVSVRHRVGEAVGPVEVRLRRVAVAAVLTDRERPVLGPRIDDDRQVVVVRIAVVRQHVAGHRAVLDRRSGIVPGFGGRILRCLVAPRLGRGRRRAGRAARGAAGGAGRRRWRVVRVALVALRPGVVADVGAVRPGPGVRDEFDEGAAGIDPLEGERIGAGGVEEERLVVGQVFRRPHDLARFAFDGRHDPLGVGRVYGRDQVAVQITQFERALTPIRVGVERHFDGRDTVQRGDLDQHGRAPDAHGGGRRRDVHAARLGHLARDEDEPALDQRKGPAVPIL